MDDVEQLMAGADHPVALPPAVRDRMAGVLAAASGAGEPLTGSDRPRPLPGGSRERLASALGTPRAARSGTPRWLGVAAAVILLGGLLAAATMTPGGHGARSSSAASTPEAIGGSGAAQGAASAGQGTAGTSGSAGAPIAPPRGAAGSGAAAGAGSPGVDSATAAPTSVRGPAPPFAFTPAPAASSTEAGPAASGAAIDVAVVDGDAAERQGFDAYLSVLDAGGGISGRPLRIGSIAPVATVNLSDAALSASAGPALETLAVPESRLRAPVYDLSSAPAHQATAAVAVMFPRSAPGTVAVVVRGTGGIWAGEVADAFVAALRQRLVTPVVVTYTPGQPFSAPPSTAAFLSLDTADARSWLGTGYRPSAGIAGVFSIVEPSLLRSLPPGTVGVAPYALAGGAEQAALAQAIGAPPGMAAVHGWVTAKALAVALWESGATTPAATAQALAGLTGYRDGWAPPLAYRPGTTSRTPDGTVLRVDNGAFVGDGSFVVGS